MTKMRWSRAGWPLVAVSVLLVVMLGPLVAPYSPTAATGRPFQAPSAQHLLGTDVIGRDVLSRMLHGGLPLVSIAGVSIVIAYAAGLGLGLLAGLRRGIDGWIMRPVDAIVVVPWFLMLAVIATALGAGPGSIVVTAALAAVPWIIRIVRTAVHEIAATGYVESARARGEPLWRLAVVEVLPNLRSVVLADAGVRISVTISLVAVSGFLGLGLRPPSPDWALMITENRPGFGVQPWAVLGPAGLVMALVVSVNMLTDRALAKSAPRQRNSVVRGGGAGLAIEQLTVVDHANRLVLADISVRLEPGRSLAVIGPSGAGKTTFALAVLGALPPELRAVGSVVLGAAGTDRRTVGYVPQDPATGLNPALRVGTALAEIARLHARSRGSSVLAEALRRVGLPADRGFQRRFPHELSGGQQQRVLLAMALLGEPAIVVLDEPTTGLDGQTRDELVRLLGEIRRASATMFLIVTHDLPAVAELIDDVAELDKGQLISFAPLDRAASAPAAAIRAPEKPSVAPPVLRVEQLSVGHHQRGHFLPVAASISFELRAGECLAVTGRSGAGKTTVARALAGLHPPEAGTVELDGQQLATRIDRRPLGQRRAIQLIFQNPSTSLNPAYSVGSQIRRPLRLLRGLDPDAATKETIRLLEAVQLDPHLARRHPTQLSGGQQQRIAIARALAANPRILICDEITASLDPKTQDTIIALLEDLRHQGLALLLITHQPHIINRLASTSLSLDPPPALVSR